MLDTVVVGCGKAGENHVRELLKLGSTRVVAVCDTEPLMAELLAQRCGIPRHYADVDAMLARERPQVAHIATPPQSHFALAARALDAGCHVVVEKPLAPTHAEAMAIVQHAKRVGRLLTIAYGFYFDPIARTMRQLIADGVLGDPVHVESFLGYALDGQFGAPVTTDVGHWVHELPGKLLHNVIDHILNKVTEFVRGDRPAVTARAWQRHANTHPVFAIPDEARMMIADDRVSAYATFSAHARPLAHYQTVFGTRNTLHLDYLTGTLTMRSASSFPGAVGRLATTFDQSLQHLRAGSYNAVRFARADFHVQAGLQYLFGAFHDSIVHEKTLPIAYAEMLRVNALTHQVLFQLQLPQQHSA